MVKAGITIPNQINQATAKPTLRWVFQCFEGINLVQLDNGYQYEQVYVDGMDDIRRIVIRQLAGAACRYYKIENYGGGV